jgi:hypothetical protein
MNGHADSITTPTSLEHALRVALQALEARWPRRFDADSQRDHAAIKAVNAALETIEAGKRAATEAAGSEGNVVVTEAAEVIVRPNSATREVTLSIQPRPDTASTVNAMSLVLPASLARHIGALLVASGEVLTDAKHPEGGAA